MADDRRRSDLLARLALLRDVAHHDEGPHRRLLSELCSADPARVAFLLAPTGRSFGVGAAGEGEALARTVTDWTRELLDGPAADLLARGLLPAAGGGPGPEVGLALSLGDPSRVRAWVALADVGTLRTILDAVEAGPDVRDRALRYEGTPGATPRSVSVFQAPPDRWELLVTTDLAADSPARPDVDALGDGPAAVGTVVTHDGRDRVRRPGLDDGALVDWGDARGFGPAAAGRLGEVHAELRRSGPDELVWERGDPEGTVVYVYEEPVG